MGGLWCSREQGLLATAAGLWTACFLAAAPQDPPWWTVSCLALAWAAATWISRPAPLLGAALGGAAYAATLGAGIPTENPAPMVASLLIVYSNGRFLADASGLLAVPLLLAATALPGAGASPGGAVFGAFLYIAGYVFGRLVRRRFKASAQVVANTARLGVQNPVQLARMQVDAETSAVAEESLAVIGSSIDAMCRAAAHAARTLQTADITRITTLGTEAVGRLKTLLVDLRAGVKATGPQENTLDRCLSQKRGSSQKKQQEALQKQPRIRQLLRPRTLTWLAPSLIVGGLLAVETIMLAQKIAAIGLVTALVVAAALTLRERNATATCAVIAAALALCAFTGTALPEGLALGISCVVAVWCAIADGRILARIGAAFLAAVLLLALAAESTGGAANLPFNLALLGFTAFAAHAWHVHGRAEQDALTEMGQLQLRFTSSFDATLAAGRLELARSVHDAASHAVGAMVIQSNAALAMHERNPEAARAALELVLDIGRSAGRGLTVLKANTVEPPKRSALQSLQSVMDQVAAAGTTVTLGHVNPVPQRHAAVAYRIMREALFNAARHAPGSPVTISIVTSSDGSCIITVDNSRTTTAATPGGGTGFGLQGLHELVSSSGGTLRSGPVHDTAAPSTAAGRTAQGEAPASGFQLVAVLPAEPEPLQQGDA
ncbi:sensor histidine kinase [Arthrobacter sp.]|uniref:sensor histidine kinase n=1 Tax=Arthrobacter sp. TaxID=1667 RepID=UPI0026DF9983|nr:hypothetical protein [Arthrobacter sp.]MDO5751545.1 hypothetical protein [Arthrobacter sp.]